LEAALAAAPREIESVPSVSETFRILAENVPGVVYLCNNDARYSMRYLNDGVFDLLGIPQSDFLADLVSFVELYHPDDAASIVRSVDAAIAARKPYHLTYRLRHADGHWVWVEEHGQGVFDADGKLRFLEGAVFDVSDRKRAEETIHQTQCELEQRVRQRTAELAASEERFRQLAENIGEIFWISTPDKSQMLYISPAYERVFGRTCESVYRDPKSFLEAIHPDDRRRIEESLPRQSRGDFEEVYRIIRPDGMVRWLWARAFPVRDKSGKVYRVAGITEDITMRKLAEQRLVAEEQSLRKQLELHERERKLFAYEIHDGLLQDVIGTQLLIDSVRHQAQQQGWDCTNELDRAWNQLSRTIAEGRRLITQLRPIVIDEHGLIEAIHHLIADEKRNSGLIVAFSHEVKFDRLPSLFENALFRITQEALNNARRHSGEKRARVVLTQGAGHLRLVIHDDGVGFDPSQVPDDRFGLEGMRKRAQLCGGRTQIQSAPGQGTTIMVEVPLPEAEAPQA
jgi:PAS domain S-box-containing protein